MTHVTKRTWTPDDLRRLQEMAERGYSAARAAVALRRRIAGIKVQPKKIGCPFPDERVLKRERRAREQRAGV
jgi:stalled ribosome rescue protein Dom34